MKNRLETPSDKPDSMILPAKMPERDGQGLQTRLDLLDRVQPPVGQEHRESAQTENESVAQVFLSLDDARGKIEPRRNEYNRQRPHSSLGYLAPEESAASHSQVRSARR